MDWRDALNIAQTVAIVAATLLSMYALRSAAETRRRDRSRQTVETLLDAVKGSMEAAIIALEVQGQGAGVVVAQQRLRAALTVAGGGTRFPQVDILARQSGFADIRDQSEAAILELARAIDDVE